MTDFLAWRRLSRWLRPPSLAISIPMDVVDAIIAECGAHPWFGYIIRSRTERQELASASRWIVSNIGNRARIFETGCGCGSNLIWLGQRGYRNLSGVDISESAISAARRLSAFAKLRIAVEVGDSLDPQLQAHAIDILLALNWTYYLEDFDLGRFFRTYRPFLANGGKVILDMIDKSFDGTDNNQYHTADWDKPEVGRRPSEYKVRMSRDEVAAVAAESGLRVCVVLNGGSMPPRLVYIIGNT